MIHGGHFATSEKVMLVWGVVSISLVEDVGECRNENEDRLVNSKARRGAIT